MDSHGRILRDLRVSVTDRCDFRCLSCLPETEAAANSYRDPWAKVVNSTPIARPWKPKSKILTFEKLERFVRLAVGLGFETRRAISREPWSQASTDRHRGRQLSPTG
jgi:cyclic pyranopterin phosphate synthase